MSPPFFLFSFFFRDLILQRLFERGFTRQDLEKTLREIPFVSQNNENGRNMSTGLSNQLALTISFFPD
jgi:uncharacterized protein Smg (DUF494 family)